MVELESVFGRTREMQILTLTFLFAGIALLLANYYYFLENQKLYSVINVIAGFMILGPILFTKYVGYRRERELENRLPDFLRDVAEAIRSGMTLPQAIKHVSKTNYGSLTKYVRQISAQIDWGIPFEKIFLFFAEKTKNRVIKRAISTIIETHRSGGNMAEVLTSVVESLIEINKLREERMAHVYSQIITGYMIYFIFLGIMVGLLKFLLPGMIIPESAASAEFVAKTSRVSAQIYREMFQRLVVIEGAFAGLAIGKMSEGSIIAGIKHSLVLVSIGYMVFVFFG